MNSRCHGGVRERISARLRQTGFMMLVLTIGRHRQLALHGLGLSDQEFVSPQPQADRRGEGQPSVRVGFRP